MNTLRKLAVAALFIAVHVTSAQPAWAADANELTNQGLRLRREGKDLDALPLFQEALRLQASPRALGQLGFCEQALGLWTSAENHLLAAVKQTDDPWVHKNEAALRESLKVVQEPLGSVEFWGTPPGARISIDGVAAGSLPLERALRAAEGQRVFTIEAPNHVTASRVLNVRARVLVREHVALVPVTADATTPSTTATTVVTPARASPTTPVTTGPQDRRSDAHVAGGTPDATGDELPTWRRVLPWTLLGGAVVAGTLGIWQQTAWNNGVGKFEANPACGISAPMKGNDSRCQGLFNDFSSARKRTLVAYGAAGVLGLGAATLFIVNAVSGSNQAGGGVTAMVGAGEAQVFFTTKF